jgi:hypothetical protein
VEQELRVILKQSNLLAIQMEHGMQYSVEVPVAAAKSASYEPLSAQVHWQCWKYRVIVSLLC